MQEPSNYQKEIWRKDPDNWKFGLFYFNKKDPRFMVDKPIPAMGITFNFAHKSAYLYLLIMSAFFGLVIFTISTSKNH
jgi:uncharacterized membrane protein